MEKPKVVVVDLTRFFGVFNSLTKRCAKNGCTETFIHGQDFEGGSLCRECSDDFLDIDQGQYKDSQTWAKCRKYIDVDFQGFLKIPYEDVVTGYDIFMRTRPKVEEMSSSESEEEGSGSDSSSGENSFKERLKKLMETLNPDVETFKMTPIFLLTSDPNCWTVLTTFWFHYWRLDSHHALYHKLDKKCDDCDSACDTIELCHHTRGLGTLWLETVRVTYEDHESKLKELNWIINFFYGLK